MFDLLINQAKAIEGNIKNGLMRIQRLLGAWKTYYPSFSVLYQIYLHSGVGGWGNGLVVGVLYCWYAVHS